MIVKILMNLYIGIKTGNGIFNFFKYLNAFSNYSWEICLWILQINLRTDDLHRIVIFFFCVFNEDVNRTIFGAEMTVLYLQNWCPENSVNSLMPFSYEALQNFLYRSKTALNLHYPLGHQICTRASFVDFHKKKFINFLQTIIALFSVFIMISREKQLLYHDFCLKFVIQLAASPNQKRNEFLKIYYEIRKMKWTFLSISNCMILFYFSLTSKHIQLE